MDVVAIGWKANYHVVRQAAVMQSLIFLKAFIVKRQHVVLGQSSVVIQLLAVVSYVAILISVIFVT